MQTFQQMWAAGLVVAAIVSSAVCSAGSSAIVLQEREHDQRGAAGELRMRELLDAATGRTIRIGTYTVWEDRDAKRGRTIDLEIAIIAAASDDPAPDRVFFLAGGPGQAAAPLHRLYLNHWITRDRDMVFVSQRGTGNSNGMCFASYGAGLGLTGPQRYLGTMLDVASIKQARQAFGQRADLTKYTTPIAMDDLNEVRAALGYGQINLMGGSYGTRASLVYMRQHPQTVRCAILNGIAPIEFTNPLYHASEAQKAIERIFDLCAADPACSAAYPDLMDKLHTVLDRLEQAEAEVEIIDPETNEPVLARLSRQAFASAIRFMMYYDHAEIPMLVQRAFDGDYQVFAQRAVQNAIWVEEGLALGMLLCVTCSEDVPRIDPDAIDAITAGTFLGDARVRAQIEACSHWPRGDVPDDYGEPVRADVPTLLLSGTLDPVTGPDFGTAAHRNLPNSVHVIAPGSHGVAGPCIDQITRDFLTNPTPDALDTSCVDSIRLRPFVLPASNH